MDQLLGGIEAGGTKFVCAVGRGPSEVLAIERFPTTTPAETIARAIEFFGAERGKLGPLTAIGIASFGPIDPSRGSPTFGHITSTPKPHWQNVDLAGAVARGLDVPVGFDTDVNAAALGEWRWGAGHGVDNLVYITIGTGIGGGALVGGKPVHGMIHPEMGHIRIPHDWSADPYPGHCPFHGDCLEGLACGPAISDRWKQPSEQLPADHPAWALEARYLALAVVNIVCTLSPERIILGGGVMSHAPLYPLIRAQVSGLLNNYVQAPAIQTGIDSYIVPPGLGDRSGVLGALVLAEQAAARA